MVGTDICFTIAQGKLLWYPIWGEQIGENWHTAPLSIHSLHWNSTTNWRIATLMGALTPVMNRSYIEELVWVPKGQHYAVICIFVSIRYVSKEAWPGGLTLGFATHFHIYCCRKRNISSFLLFVFSLSENENSRTKKISALDELLACVHLNEP